MRPSALTCLQINYNPTCPGVLHVNGDDEGDRGGGVDDGGNGGGEGANGDCGDVGCGDDGGDGGGGGGV